MNIFLTDKSNEVCARNLDDLRLNKMILETAQLTSTACHMLRLPDDRLYRCTHYNHPCAVFTRLSTLNFMFTVEHGLCLAQEYHYRNGYTHASEDVIKISLDVFADGVAKGHGLTPGIPSEFALSFNCSGFNTGDVYEDYRMAMRSKWLNDKRPPKWAYRGPPEWR